MVFENLHSFGDESHRLYSGDWFGLQEEIDKPIQVGERSCGVDYARQDFILGLGADLP